MATATLTIGGRSYRIGCRDGGEAHLEEVAALLDAKVAEAGRAMGALDEVRQLLLGALLLADELNELSTRSAPPAAAPGSRVVTAIETLADRVEQIADTLYGAPGAA